MTDDYRNTKYCSGIEEVTEKKRKVADQVLADHPRVKDYHTYISANDKPYKLAFIRAYSGKCAYCGVSIEIVPKQLFEIDHFIHQKAGCFQGSKAKAGYIENLVLACHDCNRAKSSFEFPKDTVGYLFPDSPEITKSFTRDKQYYIQISEGRKNNQTIVNFYNQMKFGAEIHRLDYLLMSMIGLQKKLMDKPDIFDSLADAINLLKEKRNLMG